MDAAKELIRAARVEEALDWAKQATKASPGDVGLRMLLFQLFALRGEWQRARTQLDAAEGLDAAQIAVAHVFRAVLACEAFRAEVFAGRRTPHFLGQPEEWVALLTESLRAAAEGELVLAAELRARAFDAAPAEPGAANGQAFDWIADADGRLGPMLELIVDGRYYWVPGSNVQRLQMREPAGLTDLIWQEVHVTWINGGQAAGFMPVRYPGTETSSDGALLLGRRTEWDEGGDGAIHGLGQRIFTTEADEYPLLELRDVQFGSPDAG